MITKFTKSILIAAIIILGSMSNATAKASKVIVTQMYENNSSEMAGDSYYGVSGEEITSYLYSFGYRVIKMEGVPGVSEVICKTSDNKTVIVHIADGQIIGHDEIII